MVNALNSKNSINLSGFGCLIAEQRYAPDKSLHSIYVTGKKTALSTL